MMQVGFWDEVTKKIVKSGKGRGAVLSVLQDEVPEGCKIVVVGINWPGAIQVDHVPDAGKILDLEVPNA